MSQMELRNCEFSYRCNALWEKLQTTTTDNVRFCTDCGKAVHRCDTYQELIRAIKLNHCVAIPKEGTEETWGGGFLVGIPRVGD